MMRLFHQELRLQYVNLFQANILISKALRMCTSRTFLSPLSLSLSPALCCVLSLCGSIGVLIFVHADMCQIDSKGKGFQGGMKRWNFSGLAASHGVSVSHRSIGSTGQNQVCLVLWHPPGT
jgi:hypothetical protein